MSYSKHAESKLLLKVIEKQQNTITSLSKNAETLDSGKNKERKNTPRKPKATRDELYEALPTTPIHCDVPEAARFCPDCNAPMNHLGYTFVRVIPAKVYRVQYFQEKLVCPTCHEEDDTTIIAAKTPTPLFPHSPASPDMAAMVMYNKGALYLPFYRQERQASA